MPQCLHRNREAGLNSPRLPIISVGNTPVTALWVSRGLELVWLLIIVSVPLVFLRISSSPLPLPFPIEVSKIAYLRTLTGLMTVLWLMEWGLWRTFPLGTNSTRVGAWGLRIEEWLPKVRHWFSQPATWVVLAVWFYGVTVLVSTLFSTSLRASVWGRVPGTDTYAAYTVICYFLLFGVLVTHLKTKPQLWRLLGTIIGMGTLVAGYSVLQYYGQNFLGLAPSNPFRMDSTLGNPIFAASVMLITIAITLMVATATLVNPVRTARFWSKASLWSLVLAVQLAGIIFTLSRGPWVGTIVALLGFIGLVAIFIGWRALGRTLLVLVIALILAVMITVVPSQMGWYERESGYASAANIGERFTSIQREATIGSLSKRKDIWSDSWRVIATRPLFGFDPIQVSAVRHLIGYGPDMLPVVYMLGSAPIEAEQLPLETNHAHNYFIHQWVELGILGFFASVGVFVAPFLVGGYQLIWERRKYSILHKVMLIGVLSALVGRFVEQTIGVAKVSDLVLWWIILAVVVSLPRVMATKTAITAPEPPLQTTGGRRRRRDRRNPAAGLLPFNAGNARILGRIAVVTLLIAGILTLTWYRTGNNVRAVFQVASLNESYQAGDLRASTSMLNDAIALAPDVYVYHDNLGTVYSAYLNQGREVREPGCSLGTTNSLLYETCLARKVFLIREEAVARSPWRWQSRLDLANAAAALALLTHDGSLGAETIRLYDDTANMVPASWKLQNQLAKNQIMFGDPEAALLALEGSLDITGGTVNSAEAFLLRGLAYEALDQLGDAIKGYDQALRLDPKYVLAYYNRGNSYALMGQYSRAIEDYSLVIDIDPEYTGAFKNRGNAYVLIGQFHLAIKDYDETIRLDPQYALGYGSRAWAYAALNMYPEARQDLERAVELGVDPALLKKTIAKLEIIGGIDGIPLQSK